MKNKQFVRIQSNMTIRVTPGLQHNDVTNPDAHVADRLKISPNWPKGMIIIEQGAHVYPADVIEWPTVKALAKDKVLTIGEYLDDADDKAVEQANKLEAAKEILAPKAEKTTKLADIAGDEE